MLASPATAATATTATVTGPQLLLEKFAEDELGGALVRVVKRKDDVGELATNLWVKEENVTPHLGHFLRRVPVIVTQTKVTDNNTIVVVVQAYSKSAADLVLDHVPFLREGVLCAELLELRPTSGRDRDDGEVEPAIELLIAVMSTAADDDVLGQDNAIAGEGVVAAKAAFRPRRRQCGRQVASPAQPLFITGAGRLPVTARTTLVGGTDEGEAYSGSAGTLAGLGLCVPVGDGPRDGVSSLEDELRGSDACRFALDRQVRRLAIEPGEWREYFAILRLDHGDEVALGIGGDVGGPGLCPRRRHLSFISFFIAFFPFLLLIL